MGGMTGRLLDFQVRLAERHKLAVFMLCHDSLDEPVKIARLDVTQSFWFT